MITGIRTLQANSLINHESQVNMIHEMNLDDIGDFLECAEIHQTIDLGHTVIQGVIGVRLEFP